MGRRDNYSARRKELRYLKAVQPGFATRVPNDAAVAHIRYLFSYGWTGAEIEAKSGVGATVISDHLHGRAKTIYTDTEAAILGVKLTPLDLETGPGLTSDGRALGSHRLVTGLAALGWTYQAMSLMRPEWGAECFRRYAQTPGTIKVSQISKTRYLELKAFALSLEPLDPVADGGAIQRYSRACKTKARTHGYAPLGAWDPDTIHLPESYPEWTGACGTIHGRTVHMREGIPMCPRCHAAFRDRKVELKEYTFSAKKMTTLMDRLGMSKALLAERLDVAEDTVHAYRLGIRRPPPERGEDIATLLGVDIEELAA